MSTTKTIQDLLEEKVRQLEVLKTEIRDLEVFVSYLRKEVHSNFVGMPAPKPNIGDEMPKGPQGQERPIDVIGCEVKIAKITTGEAEDTKIEQILEKKLIDTPTQKR